MKRNFKLLPIALCLVLGIVTGCMSEHGQNSKHVSKKDKEFVKDAAQVERKEVEMGRLGLERAHSPHVQQLARLIHEDHIMANEELMTISRRKGIAIPATVHQSGDVSHMEAVGDQDFDQVYVHHIIDSHKEEIQRYQAAAHTLSNPEVRSYAARTLPILKDHVRMAESIANSHTFAGESFADPAGAGR
jgi:putative membrane protein